MIVVLLLLPFLLFWIGPPPREEAYKSIPVRFGVPAREVEAIYDDPRSPDIAFLGSSLMMNSIYPRPLEQVLSSHFGRPAHVVVLGMYFQGLDLQYFILRDFLQHHHPGLIVLNLPSQQFSNGPHPEAYRWFRYGDSQDDFTGLPMVYKMEIYGHMVLGGPRELLSRIRPNLLAADEATPEAFEKFLSTQRAVGYHGSRFIPADVTASEGQLASLLPPHSPMIALAARPPAPYPLHFFRKVLALAKEHHCKLVFIHIPLDEEFGETTIPEFDWFGNQASSYQTIGVPASALFAGMSKEQFLHYFFDFHMNKNGSSLFMAAITPALIKTYDESHTEPPAETQAKY